MLDCQLSYFIFNTQIPGFNKKDELLDSLCEHCVPMKRAVWFIKVCLLLYLSPW